MIVGLRRVVEKTQDALAAAVGCVEENHAVAARQVGRLQDKKITRILDSAAAVARRFVEIDDNTVQPIFRIYLAIQFAGEFFIGAGDGEFVAAGERLSSLNDEASDHDGLNSCHSISYAALVTRGEF